MHTHMHMHMHTQSYFNAGLIVLQPSKRLAALMQANPLMHMHMYMRMYMHMYMLMPCACR